MSPRPRLALVSLGVPPSASGQARVLGHLLAGGNPADCLMLSEFPPQPDAAAGEVVPGLFQRLRPHRDWLMENRLMLPFPQFNSRAGLGLAVWRRAREIVAKACGFKPQVLVGCTASPFDLAASAKAAAQLGVPFVAYLFDDPIYQWAPGHRREFARTAEPRWAAQAAGVIAPNEFMARDFLARTGMACTLVRNPVDEAAFAPSPPPPGPTEGPVHIVYTGSIYHAQDNAIINLVRAMEGFGDRLVLDLYTSQSPHQVAGCGIAGPAVRVLGHVSQQKSYALQRAAGLLFLPLAFNSTIPEVLDSAAPAKLGEFLASCRPLLVHAPASSFIAQHIRQHEAGFVVDEPSVPLLAEALRTILAGGPEVARRQANALQLAELYGAETARDAFWGLLARVAAEHRRT